MKLILRTAMICATAFAALGNISHAVSVPFVEDFTTDGANWANNAEAPVTHVAAGGPDNDAFVTASVAFSSAPPNTNGVAAFRGHNNFNSSGDAFVGNWLTAGVGEISAYFRHNETDPALLLTPFVRIATTANFPGLAIEASAPIPAGQWTKVVFDIDPSNPLLTVEGPPSVFNSAMGNVGNVQFGFSYPEAFAGSPVVRSFDLDRVAIRAPEPGSIGLLIAAVVSISAFARKRVS